MTFPRVSRSGRHFANAGDVIIYPDLVVARAGDGRGFELGTTGNKSRASGEGGT